MISSDSKKYKVRQRASSFNHSVTYKQRARRPSYNVLSKKISTLDMEPYYIGRDYSIYESIYDDDIDNISDYYLDQYGFLKGTQWISEEKFEEFECQYAPIVKRRQEKWKQLLSDNQGKWPSKSSKLKRYIRKGIPSEMRGQAWLHYSGAKTKLESSRGLYDDLVQKAQEMGSKNEHMDIIERDLHRTFPDNSKFKIDPPLEKKDIPMIQSLKRVLLAFSLYSPTIGYCQSLNYIAGVLLLFMTEEEAFWTLVALITEILPPNIYDVTMEGANIDQNVLMHLVSERHPILWNKISPTQAFWTCEELQEGGMPTCSLVTSHWFLTLYINILPFESVFRVWDCLF
ncbi:rab-GTPase-TBC domain-containing protein [Sporodiniella umbellata]|nr:rab-GTPase-TBC domain-containing protein [Sporodiniella umbellata]